MATTTVRDITTCWQNNGFHVGGAGPCFDRMEWAINYRESCDYAESIGDKWWRYPSNWPPVAPPNWVNPKNAQAERLAEVDRVAAEFFAGLAGAVHE